MNDLLLRQAPPWLLLGSILVGIAAAALCWISYSRQNYSLALVNAALVVFNIMLGSWQVFSHSPVPTLVKRKIKSMPEQLLLTQTPDDEIILSLVEQRMVTHETVRLNVNVNLQRDPDKTEAAMRASIRDALSRFVKAEWRFTTVDRSRGQTVVHAVARVPESENTELAERANRASTPGLELINPQATYALPFNHVQQINRELRVALVDQARAECESYNKNKSEGQPYRVARVEFAVRLGASAANNMRAGSAYGNITSGQYSASSALAAAEEPDDEGAPDLGVTERHWVAAQVTLRAKGD